MNFTNIPHSVLTRDINTQSTLWHLYTDDHRERQIADVISNSDHIRQNTPTRVPNTTLQQTSSLDITTVSNTLYNRTSWITQHALSSDHLRIITTINMRHDYKLQQDVLFHVGASCILDLHQQTTSHTELMRDAHKTQTYICMTKHSYFPYTSTYRKHTTYFNTRANCWLRVKFNLHYDYLLKILGIF